ncbi:hypothetical protein [Aquabacterium sp.]|uniref:hypothetical protein n=1 Tax=Aquabacterium sp. TaxID=1872578 RepID=UPI003D6D932F
MAEYLKQSPSRVQGSDLTWLAYQIMAMAQANMDISSDLNPGGLKNTAGSR